MRERVVVTGMQPCEDVNPAGHEEYGEGRDMTATWHISCILFRRSARLIGSAEWHRMRPSGRRAHRPELSMTSTTKTSPVIVITGTPGTGKSTHAELLVQESPVPLRHINVSEFVKEKELYENLDAEWDSYIVDEDKARSCAVRRLDCSG